MKLKSFLLYTLFFMAAVIVFVVVLFPQKQVAAYLSQTLTAKSSLFDVTVGAVKPTLPAGLKFINTTIRMDRSIQIVPDALAFYLNPVSLLKEKKQIRFESSLYQGSVNGYISADSITPFGISKVSLLLSGITIKPFRYRTDKADMVLSCKLNGKYDQIETRDNKKSGQGTMVIINLSVAMKDDLFSGLNLSEIDFSEVNIDFTRQGKMITVKQCTARGPVLNIRLKGSVKLTFPLENARLNMDGVLLPDSPFLANFATLAAKGPLTNQIRKNGIRFRINGTLDHPKIGL